ncbi:MAG: hypothetical protein ACJAX5_000612 [Patiriisocius sp.]|jgi:hypothetical protein
MALSCSYCEQSIAYKRQHETEFLATFGNGKFLERQNHADKAAS